MQEIAVGLVVGLFVLDRAVLSPAAAHWKEQSERIASLSEKVKRGDLSAAESDVFKAISRWARESRIGFTSLNPQWREHRDEGYDTYECRASATGDQAAIGRLLYEIETDALPARIEECEVTARDAQGKQLLLAARFSFIRINDAGRSKR